MLFLFISFIAGVLTVLAPCVLPLLPVIIGGSITDGDSRRKSYAIIISLIVSIVAFTLLLKYSTAFINVSPLFWQLFSGGILIILAIGMIIPGLWESLPFARFMNREGNMLMGAGYRKKSLLGDILIGAALGPVFSSCSPTYFVILATVLPAHFFLGFTYLIAYALGLGIVLFLIGRFGQRLTAKLEKVSDPHSWVKRGVGILFLLVGIFVITGTDKKVQASLLQSGKWDVTNVEQHLLEQSHQ